MAGEGCRVRVVGVILIAAALAGCSRQSDSPGSLGGIGTFFAGPPDPDYSTYSPKDLYDLAEQSLEVDGKEDDAIVLFQEVERLYPYTEWAKRALIMQAFTLHKTKNYEESRIAAQRYLDFYPAEEDAAYAQYLLALSYYDQIDEVGRDQGLTYQALQALREVIEKYPDSEYAASSMMKFDLAFDHLAGKEMEIGRYYLKRGNYTAAINRFRVVVADYQTTSQTPEALLRLVESYLALGMTDDAQTAGAVLGYNYQSSPFYQDAFQLLAKSGLSPQVKGNGWLTSVYRQMVRGEWL